MQLKITKSNYISEEELRNIAISNPILYITMLRNKLSISDISKYYSGSSQLKDEMIEYLKSLEGFVHLSQKFALFEKSEDMIAFQMRFDGVDIEDDSIPF